MPRRTFDDEPLDDREFPDPTGDDGDTMPCPHCRAEIYEDAERCPRCGNYLSREDMPTQLSPWMLVGVVVCLIIALGWVLWR